MELVGQILGWIAAGLTFLSYQCKEHKKLILVQSLATIMICISYLLLDARSGVLTNVVCLLRNFMIYRKDIKIFTHPSCPYILAGIMALAGALSWQGPMSLLVVIALAANTLFLYFPNVQRLRKSILVTSTMVVIYNIYYSVWGGVANEAIAIISSAIGIFRYNREKKTQA